MERVSMIRIPGPQSRRQRETLRVAGQELSMAAVLIPVVAARVCLSAAEFDADIPCGWQHRAGTG
jgi:hypothetical protein